MAAFSSVVVGGGGSMPTTSAGVATTVTDETGTGALVLANTPTLVTPVLGAATATSINSMKAYAAYNTYAQVDFGGL
jgi:hypothetical protein